MRILLVNPSSIPVTLYGGTERVIWSLGRELARLGHKLSYLVSAGSHCDFASVLHIKSDRPIIEQIPDDVDVVHFNFTPGNADSLKLPYIITIHGNSNDLKELDKNTVFVSKNHATRYNSASYVHNGLDWDEYTPPELNKTRKYFHFLGNAAWRVKNVRGAIDVIRLTKAETLKVMGGRRFNIKMGMRFTFSRRISFEGMVGGKRKDEMVNSSKGLIFPVKWHEPFGLAIIESLYYGCPVFGTPYGSLPELVPGEFGFLSMNKSELAEAIVNAGDYSPQKCHNYAVEQFNSKKMAQEYLNKYEKVLRGEPLNKTSPRLTKIQEQKFLDWN